MPNLKDEAERQSVNASPDNFICQRCGRYKGKGACAMNVFIAFVGANTSGCCWYEKGKECRHCGRIT